MNGLAVATFTVEGMHHALVAARLSAEFGIGVRHGCFCAHPYLIRLLGVGSAGVARARDAVRRGDKGAIPGAVRASCGLGTSGDDVDALLDALRALATGVPAPVTYVQDRVTGDFWPEGDAAGWSAADRPAGAACAAGLTRRVRRRVPVVPGAHRRGPGAGGLHAPRRRHDGAHRGLGDGRRLGDAAGHGRHAGPAGRRTASGPGWPWAACPRRSPTPPGMPACSS